MPRFESLLKQYDYELPSKLIAQKPAFPKDSARLLVFSKKTHKTHLDTFANIGKYLPKNSVLVFNQTKVVPARLKVLKPTGGRGEILYIDHDKKLIKVLSNKKLKVGDKVFLLCGKTKKEVLVLKKSQGFYFLKPKFATSQIKSIMEKYGQTPLPPYIKNSPLSEAQRRKEYQSIFAKQGLSVAAPTASLHFTKKLIQKLKKQGIQIKFITLNVNLGTFAPLRENNLKTNRLHLENFEIDKKTALEINLDKKSGKKIIAVGTTVVRTLESAAKNYQLKKYSGQTQLFIRPPYKFQIVDGMVTNFHVPKSSLMMLVAAFMGRNHLLEAYELAIKRQFRFFSFGDGMLILP